MGGMFGESKYEVLTKIPSDLIPKTTLQKIPASATEVLSRLKSEGFGFPVIFKPDIGERGFMVKRIDSEKDVFDYVSHSRTDFLIQELVDLPLEFGVFYKRLPSQPEGEVTSVVMKEMLTITGDGQSTFQQLIQRKDRAKLQWKKLRQKYQNRLQEVLPEGATVELVSIGNHALGTKFLNGNHLINRELSGVFDNISKQIDGFYFGRFDIRCASLEDLYKGNIKILELNGCGAEPAHIYDPDFKLVNALAVLFRHWRDIFHIATENRKRGFHYTTLKEGKAYFKKFKKATS